MRRVAAGVVAASIVLLIAVLGWRPLNAWAGSMAERLISGHDASTNAAESLQAAPEISNDSEATRDLSSAAGRTRDDQPQSSVVTAITVTEPTVSAASSPSSLTPTESTTSLAPSTQQSATSSPDQRSPRYRLVAGERSYELESTDQLTVLSLMDQLASQGFSYTAQRYDYGVFITGINGVANDPASRRYWTYTVNGQSATVGADQYHLTDHDVVVWQFVQT